MTIAELQTGPRRQNEAEGKTPRLEEDQKDRSKNGQDEQGSTFFCNTARCQFVL